jgi:hypothetical protein
MILCIVLLANWNGSVGIGTTLSNEHPRNLGSIPGKDKRFIVSLERPDRLWGPPSLYDGHLWGALWFA